MVGVLVVLALAVTAIWFAVAGGPRRRGVGGRSVPPPVLPPLADVEFATELAAPPVRGEEDEPDFPVEQPEAQDDLTDIPNGTMPRTQAVTFTPGFELSEALNPSDEGGQPGQIGEVPEAAAQWDGTAEEPPPGGTDAPVTAIARSPHSLYISWERPAKGEARLRAMLGPERFGTATPCLRVFELGSDRHLAFDLGDSDDHRFLQDLEPGRRYIVALERRSAEGTRYLLSLSEPVSTHAFGNGTATGTAG